MKISGSSSRASLVGHALATGLIVLLLLWHFGVFGERETGATDFPEQPIKVVVPYPAGGGSDTFTRIIERAVSEENLLPVPLVIQNLGGGSGTIGSRAVVEAPPDGYTLLMHHYSLLGVFIDGVVEFGPDDFEAIALTGSMSMVVIVREDAPYRTLPELLDAARENPGEVTFGANQGSHAWFTAKRLEAALPGAEFATVNADGGADRYARIIGGHLDAGIFSLAEFLDLRSPEGTPPDQNIRALVILRSEPHPAVPDVPTSRSQGIDVFMENVYFWWAPKGTPRPVQDRIAVMLEAAMKNEGVLAALERLRIEPEFARGNAMRERIDATLLQMRQAQAAANDVAEAHVRAGEESGAGIPDLPLQVGILVLLLLAGVLLQHWLGLAPAGEGGGEPTEGEHPRHPVLAAGCFAVVVAYVVILQAGWLPWVPASFLLIFVTGGLLCRWERSRLVVVAELALLVPLVTAYLFTEILTGVLLP